MHEGKYHCELKDAYVLMEDSILEISGNHTAGFTDEDVQSVTIKSSIIHFLNNELFMKFPHLERLKIINSELLEIKPNAFSKCNLHLLSIEDELQTVPSRVFQNCSVIKEITLQKISEVLPDDVFYGLDSLEKLNLDDNKIEILPELSNLRNLVELSLAMNNLKILEVSLKIQNLTCIFFLLFFQNQFEENTNLTSLNLANNNLRSKNLPEDIFLNLKNLEDLNLNQNLLETIKPRWFENLISLKILDLSHNNLEKLPENSFINLNHLNILYVDFNKITELQRMSFGNNSELRILTVDNNLIIRIDQDFFENYKKLEYFSSRENECFNGFILGSSEHPINFENEEILKLLSECYQNDGSGFQFYFLWIGLGVAVFMCALFLILHFWYEKCVSKKIVITN